MRESVKRSIRRPNSQGGSAGIRKVGSAFCSDVCLTFKLGGFRDGSQPLVPIRLIIVSSFGQIRVSRLENDRQGSGCCRGHCSSAQWRSSYETIIFAQDFVATVVIAVFYRPMSLIE